MAKTKKFCRISFLLFILFLSVNSYIFSADNSSDRELFFGPSILGLGGTGLLTSKSPEGAVPLNRTALAGGRQETIHFSLDISKTSLNTIRSKDYLKIEGLKPYGNPGEPQLPFKSFVVTLPINSEVSGVSASNISYRPILNKLDIVPTPFPVAHSTRIRNEKQTHNIQEGLADVQKSYSACKTCNSESFFPGNLVSYYTGKDNSNRYVFIKFFPMQYISQTKRAILITNAEITVNYQFTNIR